jgi:hypothetical protein
MHNLVSEGGKATMRTRKGRDLFDKNCRVSITGREQYGPSGIFEEFGRLI